MPRMPQVTARDLVRFLKSQGFVEDRQSGSHLTLWHEAQKISVTIPMHTGTDIGRAWRGNACVRPRTAAALRATRRETIRGPDYPEHKERREWLGRRFDPEAFDLAAVNRKLRLLK